MGWGLGDRAISPNDIRGGRGPKIVQSVTYYLNGLLAMLYVLEPKVTERWVALYATFDETISP
jgi:hypothetical protein